MFKFVCDVIDKAEWVTLEQPGFTLPVRFTKPPAHGEVNSTHGCVSPLLFFDDTLTIAAIYDHFYSVTVTRVDQFIINLHLNTVLSLRGHAEMVNYLPWTMDFLDK
ncbi:hypothetical protein L596_025825 [Steinernema carpocapsae]|uniref:Uncharacterized protein n=1 Tax=Steinernema carpocapsae TaxID=34508 RepID=A0A4U5M8Y1_STECR|nr:hypothetical protein L596_025825 [Steinernema carpocapsae]